MKKEILKIAGVKSEKEFYKKFPTEEAFMAKHGKAFKKAQFGDYMQQFGPQLTSLKGGLIQSPTGQVTMQQTDLLGFNPSGSNFGANKLSLGLQNIGKDISGAYGKLDKSLGKVGGVSGAIGIGTDLLQGFQQLQQEKEQKRQAKQKFKLSELTEQVAGLKPDIPQRKYVRPEDTAFDTQQMGQAYGAGTTFLAQDGTMIGGNPTEIQNMYNPGNLYSDLGYEPMDDSSKVKQYKKGGKAEKAQFGIDKAAGQLGNTLGSLIGGGKGRPTAGGQIGSTIGSTVGKFIPIPGASAVLGGIGGLVGGIFGGKSAKETARYEEGAEQNLMQAAFTQGARGIQSQNASFMEDGGGLKYLSNDWQPQLITKFGDYELKDLLVPPKDADMLRAGGHLKNYTEPSERAMQTYAMGGDLTIDGRGDIEFMGYNPEAAKTGASGYIGITRGPSHDNGGFNVDYGGNTVEVEGNETVVERKEGGTVDGDKSLVILGDMKAGAFGKEVLEGVNEKVAKKALKGKDIKDVKFKHLGNQVAKITGRLNKAEDKFIDLANSVDGDSPSDLLKLSTAQAALKGINMQYKDLNTLQQNAINVQSAYHDAAEEYGYDDTPTFLSDLKKGKIKDSNMAKYGKMLTAQNGLSTWQYLPGQKVEGISFNPMGGYTMLDYVKDLPEVMVQGVKKKAPATNKKTSVEAPSRRTTSPVESVMNLPKRVDLQSLKPTLEGKSLTVPESVKNMLKQTSTEQTGQEQDKTDFIDIYNMLQPYIRPTIQNPLSPTQLTPEMMALALNTVQPVPAQTFSPELETPYTVSLQDQINEVQADLNYSRRLVGNNPEALAQLEADAARRKSSILGQQLRINTELATGAYNRNREVLNRAKLTNLEILGQQADKQAIATSKTKAEAIGAAMSVADKITRNKAETLQANVMANMYPQFMYGPKGRIFSTGLMNFNIPQLVGMNPEFAKAIAEARGLSSDSKSKSKNGSVVKALKNL